MMVWIRAYYGEGLRRGKGIDLVGSFLDASTLPVRGKERPSDHGFLNVDVSAGLDMRRRAKRKTFCDASWERKEISCVGTRRKEGGEEDELELSPNRDEDVFLPFFIARSQRVLSHPPSSTRRISNRSRI